MAYKAKYIKMLFYVAPFAGAWIEISHGNLSSFAISVAPFAGAWIEIYLHWMVCLISCHRSPRGSKESLNKICVISKMQSVYLICYERVKGEEEEILSNFRKQE